MYPFRYFDFRRSPITVVGAACPLGLALVPVLLDLGYRVRVIVRDVSRIPSGWRAHPACEIATALDRDRRVVWLAHAHHVDPRIEVRTNIRMMEQACATDRRIVFLSSGGAVYGDPESLPVEEWHPRRPLSAYGMAKCVMEDMVARMARGAGGSVILRPGNIYGREYLAARKASAITAFAQSLIAGRPVALRDGGRGARDFVHVDDVVRAIVAAIEWRGTLAVWNVGTGHATSTRDALRSVAAILNRKPVAIVHQERAATDVSRIALSSARIERACGWRPLHSLASGLPLTLADCPRSTDAREGAHRTGRETGTGLPNCAASTATLG